MRRAEKLFKLVLGSFFMASIFVNTGCSKEPVPNNGTDNNGADSEETPSEVLNIRWESEVKEDTPLILFSGGKTSLVFKAENAESVSVKETPENWEINIDKETSTVNVKAPLNGQNTSFDLILSAKGKDGTEKEAKAKILYITSFDDPKGAFVLNEGNMTTENGSLTYITPDGFVIDDAYKAVNGTELGNVCQDMAFCNGKIYIISQNGDENAVGTKFENDGMLVVVDAKTLKKEKSFSKEQLSQLYWPTHIAALDEKHIYIRDNKDNKGAIWRLDSETGELKFIQGSNGAPQIPFTVKDGKVYTYINGTIVKLLSIDMKKDETTSVNLPFNLKDVFQIKNADENNIWVLGNVSAVGNPNIIMKVNLEKPNDRTSPNRVLNTLPSPHGNASGNRFVSYKNTIYYNDDTSIYSISFDEDNSEPKMLIDLNSLDKNAKELYNGLGINPSTGVLYVNTIKGVGPFYTTNSIWEFDVNSDWTTPKNKHDNYTNFPAGFFFADNN